MSRSTPLTHRPALRRLVALLTGAVVGGALLAATASAAEARTPAVPRSLTSAIEPMAGYQGQVACDPRTRPGTAKLARLLAATYPAARSWSSTYACGTDGNRSEHYDGRAIDWMTSARNTRQNAAAKSFISWLLATDKQGNRYAMARRLGVMYVIYNNRMWGGWSGRWEDYNSCTSPKNKSRGNDNWCHRTHMHISLSWNGAMGRTTFWTNRVSLTDYGPCRAAGMNWAGRYARANLVGCPRVAAAKAGKGASPVRKALVRYSGSYLRSGSRGPAVSAVQSALKQRPTGSFTASTAAAVRTFQARHKVPVSGKVGLATWRALLAGTR